MSAETAAAAAAVAAGRVSERVAKRTRGFSPANSRREVDIFNPSGRYRMRGSFFFFCTDKSCLLGMHGTFFLSEVSENCCLLNLFYFYFYFYFLITPTE